jgi:hypothetical protein
MTVIYKTIDLKHKFHKKTKTLVLMEDHFWMYLCQTISRRVPFLSYFFYQMSKGKGNISRKWMCIYRDDTNNVKSCLYLPIPLLYLCRFFLLSLNLSSSWLCTVHLPLDVKQLIKYKQLLLLPQKNGELDKGWKISIL